MRTFVVNNATENPFVKANLNPKQLLATIQSNVGSRLVYEANMIPKTHVVGFMVCVDTETDDMEKYNTERLPIVNKVINFLETTFNYETKR